MKMITCEACCKIIKEDESRFLGTIQEANNEKRQVIRFLIIEKLDFCSAKCIFEYMILQLEVYGPIDK